MRISVYTPSKNKEELKQEIINVLLKNGFDVVDENPEVVLYFGGDGSFLRCVENYLDKLDSLLFIGINYGHLGFFYDYQRGEIDRLISDLKNNNTNVLTNNLLKGEIDFGDTRKTIYAVNEICIIEPLHSGVYEVSIDGESFETFNGNGLIVSSTLGSTAYNKSVGGAVVDRKIDLLQLSEIAGTPNNIEHSLGASIVLDSKSHIEIKSTYPNAVIQFDHNVLSEKKLFKVDVSYCEKKVNVLVSKSYTNLAKIKGSFIK